MLPWEELAVHSAVALSEERCTERSGALASCAKEEKSLSVVIIIFHIGMVLASVYIHPIEDLIVILATVLQGRSVIFLLHVEGPRATY